ncbi:MAG: hypothetical protein APF76_02180 [Desulfitibacter sp. BRH_c19]|nr:MAG: hypothetical protein APF76_02180 [Desulfitibacter sp. BRH_c19]
MDYTKLSKEELEQKLKEQKELLEEVEAERYYVLGKTTSQHVPGYLNKEYAKETEEIKKKIEEITKALLL